MDIKVGFKDRELFVKDVVKCDTVWKKFRGLMFRRNSPPLLFVFKRAGRYAIHSFFVRKKFLAVWLRKGKVVDAAVVKPWKFYVASKEEFDLLLEIPLTSKMSSESEQRFEDFSSVVRNI